MVGTVEESWLLILILLESEKNFTHVSLAKQEIEVVFSDFCVSCSADIGGTKTKPHIIPITYLVKILVAFFENHYFTTYYRLFIISTNSSILCILVASYHPRVLQKFIRVRLPRAPPPPFGRYTPQEAIARQIARRIAKIRVCKENYPPMTWQAV